MRRFTIRVLLLVVLIAALMVASFEAGRRTARETGVTGTKVPAPAANFGVSGGYNPGPGIRRDGALPSRTIRNVESYLD